MKYIREQVENLTFRFSQNMIESEQFHNSNASQIKVVEANLHGNNEGFPLIFTNEAKFSVFLLGVNNIKYNSLKVI